MPVFQTENWQISCSPAWGRELTANKRSGFHPWFVIVKRKLQPPVGNVDERKQSHSVFPLQLTVSYIIHAGLQGFKCFRQHTHTNTHTDIRLRLSYSNTHVTHTWVTWTLCVRWLWTSKTRTSRFCSRKRRKGNTNAVTLCLVPVLLECEEKHTKGQHIYTTRALKNTHSQPVHWLQVTWVLNELLNWTIPYVTLV